MLIDSVIIIVIVIDNDNRFSFTSSLYSSSFTLLLLLHASTRSSSFPQGGRMNPSSQLLASTLLIPLHESRSRMSA